MGIGCYAVVDKWASGEGFRLENVFDIIFNLAFLLIIIGGIVFIVSIIAFSDVSDMLSKEKQLPFLARAMTHELFNEKKIPLFTKQLLIKNLYF